jgi:hypothetical protein
MKERMEFCAHCAVNMFQNISHNRSDKKITLQDYKYISGVASLPFFGGGERQYEIGTTRRYYDGLLFGLTLYFIKGTGTNIAQIMWCVANYYYRNPSEREVVTHTETTPIHGNNLLQAKKIKQNYNSHEIYPGLTIKSGEIKIIVDAYLYIDIKLQKPNGNKVDPHPWKFFVLNLQPDAIVPDGTKRGYFHTIVAFTPKSGLFNEIPPE